MPYGSNDELPVTVRGHLPAAAQDIYRKTFNSAWQTYAGNPYREQISHAVSWAAVKRKYEKVESDWVLRA
jgi:cation transport regulator